MKRKPSQKGPWLRRVSVAWLAGTFLVANAVSAVFLIALADRHSVRFDVTATGEHRLAPQTRRLIEAVEPGAGFELVVAADVTRVDPRAWQALLDVGSELEAAGAMTVTALEGESARGGLEALGQRLAAREAGEMQAQAQALLRAAAELARAAEVIDDAVVPNLTATAAAAGDGQQQIRAIMQRRAQTAPGLAQDLRSAAGEVQSQLQSAIMPGVNVPALDRARSAIAAPARGAAGELSILADEAQAIARNPSYPEPLRRAIMELAQAAGPARDLCASAADTAERMETLDVVRVLRAVGDAAAAVLVGPDNAVAIDAQTLLPPPGVLRPEAATAPSLRGRVEGLVATAMLTAIDPRRPIVIVAHAEDARFIERPGALGVAIGHLRQQGIDVIEWPLMLEPDPPGLVRLDPAGARPVIHLVLNTNTSVRSPDPLAPRPDERVAKLGELVQRLVDAGQPLMVNLTPSEVVVGGGVDATAAPLAVFGLETKSGLSLVSKPTQSEVVEHDMLVRGSGGEHALQGALTGLLMYAPWAVPIEHAGDAQAWPLLVVDDEQAWGETRWSGYRRVPRAERPLVSNPPVRDAEGDDADGPWTIAWAAQREVGGGAGRVVVVGSNDWLADEIVSSGQSLDGRMVGSYPGNLALLDASVLWLSGRDEFIAPTVSSSSVAMIGQIDSGMLSALRWGLVLGVPVVILLIGGGWRVLRR
ncbi:MAG: hypothetical protein NCW75_07970 [Phycisphaera sp.]|nr:MAG: hypothetical protein NCW75_07970 [Phycisphaera sp.]